MSNINLLPWREVAKQRQKNIFLAMLGITVLLSCGVVLLVNLFFNQAIKHQEERNQFLQSEIVLLDARIGQINKLKARRQELIDRMKLIDQLQQSRNQVVHLYSDLPKLVASGVYLDSLGLIDGRIDMVGKTEAHSRVASMMRMIDKSGWLGQTNISSIFATPQPEGVPSFALSEFSMMFRILSHDNDLADKMQGAQKK
ncbi:PilN domain-containing protein [Pseudaeromonas sharmana]|uniref:PilN domain-containing protein n=1 Tax=Pseudaeromonas sharmana TaxID=328412 RepID=A0ABV8CRD3_9GAMM